jgi:leucyl/phenylalanyl-tRNA--protein transferase
MVAAYERLHDLGHAASVEVYAGERLVGGLYGVVMKPFFFGESMFAHARDASKLALGFLCEDRDFQVIDCQMPTDHLLSLGAEIVPRRSFLALLASHLGPPPLFP